MQDLEIQVNPLNPHYGSVINAIKTQNLFDLDKNFIIETYKRTGAILFRGFKSSIDDYIRFSEQYTHQFSSYIGGAFRFEVFDRKSINNNNTVLSTTGGGQGFPLPLHGEMYYFNSRPGVVWFYCDVPPQTQGETTVCSGVELFRQLSPKTQQELRKMKIKFCRHFSKEEWSFAFQTQNIDDVLRFCENDGTSIVVSDGEVIDTEYVCSPLAETQHGEAYINSLMIIYYTEWAFESGWIKNRFSNVSQATPIWVRQEDGSKIPSEMMEEIKQVGQKVQTAISWQKGDMIMIDNKWIMHGRNDSDGSERKIYARFGHALFD